MKNYQDALNDYNKAMKWRPMDAMLVYERADIKMYLTDYNGAIADFLAAKKLEPESMDDSWNKCALMKIRLGDYVGSLYFFEKAHEMEGYIDFDDCIYLLSDYVPTPITPESSKIIREKLRTMSEETLVFISKVKYLPLDFKNLIDTVIISRGIDWNDDDD